MGNQYQFISDNEILCENIKRHATVSSNRENDQTISSQMRKYQFLKNCVHIVCVLSWQEFTRE